VTEDQTLMARITACRAETWRVNTFLSIDGMASCQLSVFGKNSAQPIIYVSRV